MQPLVSNFLDSLRSKKYSENSIRSHYLDLNKFFNWLEFSDNEYDSQKILIKIRNLIREDIENYISSIKKSYKPRTIARHISSLRLFLNYLEVIGLIKISPAHQIRFPEIIPAPLEILSKEEIEALLDAPSLNHYLGFRDKAMICLLYTSDAADE